MPLQTSLFGCKISSRWSNHSIAMEQTFHRDEIFELYARVGKNITQSKVPISVKYAKEDVHSTDRIYKGVTQSHNCNPAQYFSRKFGIC